VSPEAPPLRPETPVQFLKGVGPRRSELLARLGISTLGDLVLHFPSRHLDRSAVTPLAKIRPGVEAVVQGSVLRVRASRSARKRVPVLEIWIEDGGERAVLLWFGQNWRARDFAPGDRLLAAGRGLERPRSLAVEEVVDSAPGLVPVYPATEGLGSRQIRALVRAALEAVVPVETLPEELLARRRLPGFAAALRGMHAPGSAEEAEAARRRFAYEEFFAIQVRAALRRRERLGIRAGRELRVGRTLDFRIRALFPFRLTPAQDRAVAQIRRDLAAGPPMNRLLQGDVGSGKTVVAAYALLAAVGNRAQAALMAPTEVLAGQHFRTLSRLLGASRVRLALLSGSLGAAERDALRGRIAAGEVDLVVGTHALVEEGVRFRDLALAVVDEQQKFGVLQRGALGGKGERPHVLVMTATPIPRTLALTLYGDLDLTVLDGLPPGRRPVSTVHVPRAGRKARLEFVRRLLGQGRQAYFVFPLVEESERLALRSAVRMAQELRSVFPGFRVGLLHGRMPPAEKEAVMAAFASGEIRVLASTLVVEVGVDVPNASIMGIEHAERFGLSQLHQLRGRVGRGAHESYCLLFGERNDRIGALVSTNDGFRIAEEDLRLRGPGELLGVRQSGAPALRAARLAGDAALLDLARADAFAYVEKHPGLAVPGGDLLHVG
jgi:ATP-dependent DNA helicase RecG